MEKDSLSKAALQTNVNLFLVLSFKFYSVCDGVLFYSPETCEANKTMRSIISLRSNITRRQANKTQPLTVPPFILISSL
mgnify:CR=1 FL=1